MAIACPISDISSIEPNNGTSGSWFWAREPFVWTEISGERLSGEPRMRMKDSSAAAPGTAGGMDRRSYQFTNPGPSHSANRVISLESVCSFGWRRALVCGDQPQENTEPWARGRRGRADGLTGRGTL
jgi:hypothetical protein